MQIWYFWVIRVISGFSCSFIHFWPFLKYWPLNEIFIFLSPNYALVGCKLSPDICFAFSLYEVSIKWGHSAETPLKTPGTNQNDPTIVFVAIITFTKHTYVIPQNFIPESFTSLTIWNSIGNLSKYQFLCSTLNIKNSLIWGLEPHMRHWDNRD